MMYTLDDYFNMNTLFGENDDGTLYSYYAGIYILEKDGVPIYSDYFIFDDVKDQYTADKKIWNNLREIFMRKRFSELGESIGDINDSRLKLYIEDSALFENGETFMEIESLLKEQLNVVRENYNEDNIKVYKNTKDAYDMSALKDVIEDIIIESVVVHGESFFDFNKDISNDTDLF